jgi:hypothetical protein
MNSFCELRVDLDKRLGTASYPDGGSLTIVETDLNLNLNLNYFLIIAAFRS